MNLLPHQIKFAKDYKDKGFLVHEGGTGKTICACVWLHDGRDEDAYVVCPKKIVRKWQNALTAWDTKAEVMSKENFKEFQFTKEPSALVIDEADEFASPLFLAKKRSVLSATLYEFVKKYPDCPIVLLTATPIRSNPWNLHTFLCFLGEYIEWKEWRKQFFDLVYPDNYKFKFLERPAYMPKENWRQLIRPVLEKYADIVLLKDCVDELPPVIEEKINVITPKFIKTLESKAFFDEHRHEQENKVKEILTQGKQYRKVLVVAYYREQIEQLAKQLSKDKETFIVYGGQKDQEKIIENAQKTDECYLIMQASMGVGSDCDTFSCVVFTSMSYAVRDFVQMKFRVRRIHNLHPVKYVFLIGGRCDRAVLENVEMGKDFVPSQWNDKIIA